MSLILNIDTASENASICLAREGVCITFLENGEQKDHAAWIHPAIEKLLMDAGSTISEVDAVAVTSGPGSYTGLRVGMSTAKGLCYALDIPLITENTLRVMALATRQAIEDRHDVENFLFCPMIDARRMEVFTGLFSYTLEEVVLSSAMILSIESFSDQLAGRKIVFSGNGTGKFKQLVAHHHAMFLEVHHSAQQLAFLSNQKFINREFADVAYVEPLYLKEFYTISKK
jgi:tRNA threonylcarbamoyladenosine biosynthesis protein TsaB